MTAHRVGSVVATSTNAFIKVGEEEWFAAGVPYGYDDGYLQHTIDKVGDGSGQ